MRLLTMPYIVAKEVFDHLPMQQMFILSLCSKRTKNFIKCTQKYQLAKIERVNYKMEGRTPCIEVETLAGLQCFMEFYMNQFTFIENLKESEPIEMVRSDVLGMSIDFFRPSTRPSDLSAKYCHCNVELLFEAIHNHLCDLLGHYTKYWLWSNSTTHPNFVPILRNIRGIELYGKLDTVHIEKLLATTDRLEFFSWYTSKNKSIRFGSDSRIHNADTVYVSPCRSLTSDIVKYFNGRHAFLESANIPANEVIRMLKEWQSGEKFANLEVISLKRCLGIPKILDSVEFKKLHSEATYSFIRKHEPLQHEVTSMGAIDTSCEFKTDLYMIRKSDGRVASVRLGAERVFVGVWNMTEAEFLRR